MPNSVVAIGGAVPAPSAVPTSNTRVKSDAERAADYRLVIEEGPRRGSFVYKTINRTTGELIRQFPREALVKLAEDTRYQAGTVASTKA